ncbi:MAG: DinB family protein [Chloroflexi bacterium]|nr:DinB family protein [Chloroflexota bacterium]
MQIKIGLENGFSGRSIAWVLEHPGCFAYGKEGSEAIVRVPQALISYQSWLQDHSENSWLASLGDFDVRLEEVFQCYSINDQFDLDPKGHEVNSFFRYDWKPLSLTEVERGSQLLEWSRIDLLEMIHPLSKEQMEHSFSGERWTIHGILDHVASGEQWYLNRLGIFGIKNDQNDSNIIEKLDTSRQFFYEGIQNFEGNRKVCGADGELWSARKVLRRALWHERDHYQHIQRLMAELPGNL